MKKILFVIVMITILTLTGCETSDSNKITVSFNTDGGSLIESVTTDIDTSISEPAQPIKEGYTFVGWYSDSNFNSIYDFTTRLGGNITLYAKYEINIYKLTFLDYDGTLLQETQYNYNDDLSNHIKPTPTRDGYTFTGWDSTIPDKMPANNLTLTATYSVNQYKIIFDSNEGSVLTPITKDYATTVIEPANPTKDGYTFGGWYSDAGLTQGYTFTTMPAKDITLYAKWDIITYDITYNLDGGTNGSNPNIYTVETSTITLVNPTKEGYTFNCWYDNAEHTGDSVTQITLGTIGDIALYASWTINQYTITYLTYDNFDSLNDIPLHAGETITSLSLGAIHSSAITSEGRVFTWGLNRFGQLGDGTTTDRYTPVEITNQFSLNEGETITSVSLGGTHSSAITSEGRIFTWGKNGNGQLGDGTTTDRWTLTEITDQFSLNEGETITSVSLGDVHSSAITSEGRVFTWGYNGNGQLGDGTTTNRNTPTEITNQFSLNEGETITSVSLGSMHSSAITSEGRVFTWGYNYFGQLGDGTTANRDTPTEITNQFSLNEGETIISVSIGTHHSSAITSEGRIFTWGFNLYGQLGDGTYGNGTNKIIPTEITSQFNLNTGETIISVSLGDSYSSAITSEGRVFTWGNNWYGQLGDGTTTNRNTPTEITNQFSLNEGETITSVSLRGYHSSAITSEGRVFTWGYNGSGQLGDGTTADRYTPNLLPFKSVYSKDVFTFDYNQFISSYIPTREGYTFDGWYTDEGLTQSFTFSTMPAEDITLYAKWIVD